MFCIYKYPVHSGGEGGYVVWVGVHSVHISGRKAMNAIYARHLMILIDAVSEDRFYISPFSPQYVWWFQEKYSE